MITSGIYKIINKVNLKYYVGSSKSIFGNGKGRYYEHLYALRRGRHHSPYLQRAFEKYGEDNFECILVEEISDTSILLNIEQKYLDIAKTEKSKCYNMRFKAEGGEMRKETIKKISISLKKFYAENPEYKNKIVERNKTDVAKEKHALGQKRRYQRKEERVKAKLIKQIYFLTNPEEKKKFLNSNKNKTIHTFKNRNTNEIFSGIRSDFKTKYNLNQGPIANLISGRNKSYRGWEVCL